jgi:predicted permease
MTMHWIKRNWLRAKALLRLRRGDGSSHGLISHYATDEQKKHAVGETPASASTEVGRGFGNTKTCAETDREVRMLTSLETFWQDLRYAARALWKNPAFSAVAILSLALGIGANVSIFSVLDAVVLRSLPVSHPEQLVVLKGIGDGKDQMNFPYPVFRDLRQRQQVLADLFAGSDVPLRDVRLMGSGQGVQSVSGRLVTGNYFSVLGVGAVYGRVFTEQDAAESVAVISYRFWQRQFSQDSRSIGTSLVLNGAVVTIIGVAPPEFFGESVGSAPDLWVPIGLQPQLMSSNRLEARWVGWLQVLGRLKPRVREEEAQVAMSTLYQQIMDEARQPGTKPLHYQIKLEPGSRGLQKMRERFSHPLWVLMVAVGLVLLIACGNVANLLLARCMARRREIGVRLALGASRTRLIRQLLTESLLLSFCGGLLGIGIATVGSRLLVMLVSDRDHPYIISTGLDSRLLAFAILISCLTSLLFGLVPAQRLTAIDINQALKTNVRHQSGTRLRQRLGKTLVIAQVALSLPLLIGASLLVRSLQNLYHMDAGFRREGVLLASLPFDLSLAKMARHAIRRQELIERLSILPGVQSAALAAFGPMSSAAQTGTVTVSGRVAPEGDLQIWFNYVSAGYFETLGVRLLRGRGIVPQDTATSPKVAVINQTMAQRYFGNDDPVGKLITIGQKFDPSKAVQVVGVAQDAKYATLREAARPQVFIPLTQAVAPILSFVVRTAVNPAQLTSQVRQVVREVDPELVIEEITTLEQAVERTLVRERLMANLCSGFGLLVLVLICVGLYGIMSYAVAQRTPEIGVRMAIGAQRREVIWLVLRESLLLVLGGIALGVPLALATTQLLSSLLFGLKTTDPISLAFAIALLGTVALLASYLPALRASRIDPMVALHYE